MYVMVPALSGPKNRSRPGSPKDKHDVVPVAIFFFISRRPALYPPLAVQLMDHQIKNIVNGAKFENNSTFAA